MYAVSNSRDYLNPEIFSIGAIMELRRELVFLIASQEDITKTPNLNRTWWPKHLKPLDGIPMDSLTNEIDSLDMVTWEEIRAISV